MATEHEGKLGTEDSKVAGRVLSGPHECVRYAAARHGSRPRNAHIWDVDGNEYLDFLAGIAVNSLGYAHPKVGQGGCRSGCQRCGSYQQSILRPSRKLNWHQNWSSWLVHLKAPKSTSATPVLKAMKLPSSSPSCMAAPCPGALPSIGGKPARILAMTHGFHGRTIECAVRHMETRYPQAV